MGEEERERENDEDRGRESKRKSTKYVATTEVLTSQTVQWGRKLHLVFTIHFGIMLRLRKWINFRVIFCTYNFREQLTNFKIAINSLEISCDL